MENFDLKGFAKGKKQQKEQIGGNAIIYTRVSSSCLLYTSRCV